MAPDGEQTISNGKRLRCAFHAATFSPDAHHSASALPAAAVVQTHHSMKRYLIRIELRKPFDEGVFGKLHSAMEAAGFSRDIERIREWFEFEIPTEEYLLEKEEPGEGEPEEVILQLALETATSVHENCVVTVADYGALPWDNYTKPDDVPED